MALTDSLFSYFKCDEASGSLLDAHGSNDFADNNTVGAATGIINNGRDYESGSSEYHSRSSSGTGFEFGDSDFTISLWVKLESKSASQDFIAKDNGSFAPDFRVAYNSGSDRFYVTCGGSYNLTASSHGSPSTGTLYHIVMRHDSVANTLSVVVDGGTVDSTSSGPPGTTTHTVGIGGYPIDGFGVFNYTDGILDEIGVWSRSISDAEVASLYNSGSGLAYPLTVGGGARTQRLTLLGVG